MTPTRIEEIFSSRGYAIARQVAVATCDGKLLALVERMQKEGRNFSLSAFEAEWNRRATALAAARSLDAAKAAAEREVFNASLADLASRFKRAA